MRIVPPAKLANKKAKAQPKKVPAAALLLPADDDEDNDDDADADEEEEPEEPEIPAPKKKAKPKKASKAKAKADTWTPQMQKDALASLPSCITIPTNLEPRAKSFTVRVTSCVGGSSRSSTRKFLCAQSTKCT